MQDVLMPCPPGLDAYGLHKVVYDRFAPPGTPRTFLFTPVRAGVGMAVLVRGDFSGVALPPGVARPVLEAAAGETLSFVLRANPTVKFNDKRGQIALSADKDSLRLRWLTRRAAEHGFDVLEVDAVSEPMRVERPANPFTLNVTTYTGVLRVTDAAQFAAALTGGVGRAEAWGCGLLIVRRPR